MNNDEMGILEFEDVTDDEVYIVLKCKRLKLKKVNN